MLFVNHCHTEYFAKLFSFALSHYFEDLRLPQVPSLLGRVVQSVVSFMKSLIADSLGLTLLKHLLVIIDFAEEIMKSFCTAKAFHIFFRQEWQHFYI